MDLYSYLCIDNCIFTDFVAIECYAQRWKDGSPFLNFEPGSVWHQEIRRGTHEKVDQQVDKWAVGLTRPLMSNKIIYQGW